MRSDTSIEEARALLDAARYMVLGTAGEDGKPWVSPVWFAHSGYRELYWVSAPEARHSRNLAGRPEVSIAIFDSGVLPGDAAAVYMEAAAGRAEDVEAGLAVFNAESQAQGLREWTADDVGEGARHRLFRAVAERQWVLGERDTRVEVEL